MPTPRSKARSLSRYALGLWFSGIAALGLIRFFMIAFDGNGFRPTTDAWLWLAGSAAMAVIGVFALALELRMPFAPPPEN